MVSDKSISVYLARVNAGEDRQKILKSISEEISSKRFKAQDLNDWQEGINLGLNVALEILSRYM